MGGFPKKGVPGYLSGGPYNKDSSICESTLGSPSFGELPFQVGIMIVIAAGLTFVFSCVNLT